MERINEVTKDCFNALIQFRSLDSASAVSPRCVVPPRLGLLAQPPTQSAAMKAVTTAIANHLRRPVGRSCKTAS